MSLIRPFRGLRPPADRSTRVAAPPYDVVSRSEARVPAAGNPDSFLHVTRAEIDLPEDIDVYSDAVYAKSAETFHRFLAGGVLVRDSEESFYIYRLTKEDHTQYGVMAGFSLREYEEGLIKKHERTRPQKEDDRTRHTETLMANTGPLLLTYRRHPEINAWVERMVTTRSPTVDFIASDGVGHALWVIPDQQELCHLQALFALVPELYIADGHHRAAAALRVGDRLRSRDPRPTGRKAYDYFLAAAFPDHQLKIMGYHRVVRDLNGLTPERFLEHLASRFTVTETDTPDPTDPRTFGMFLDGVWYRLILHETPDAHDDPASLLDTALLQHHLLLPILGIEDVRTSDRIDFVGGIRGTGELERRCRQDMRVAFTLYPVQVNQLMDVADSGAIMPPKSTWFEPKLRSGLVVRTLSEPMDDVSPRSGA